MGGHQRWRSWQVVRIEKEILIHNPMMLHFTKWFNYMIIKGVSPIV